MCTTAGSEWVMGDSVVVQYDSALCKCYGPVDRKCHVCQSNQHRDTQAMPLQPEPWQLGLHWQSGTRFFSIRKQNLVCNEMTKSSISKSRKDRLGQKDKCTEVIDLAAAQPLDRSTKNPLPPSLVLWRAEEIRMLIEKTQRKWITLWPWFFI